MLCSVQKEAGKLPERIQRKSMNFDRINAELRRVAGYGERSVPRRRDDMVPIPINRDATTLQAVTARPTAGRPREPARG
jgi:hypothetical protein